MAFISGTYGALLVSGLLGSLGHCLGMCGPLVIMVGLGLRPMGPSRLSRHIGYHMARIGVYALLGSIVGAIGSLFGLGARLTHVAAVVSIALGLLVILLGIGYLGWRPFGRLEGAGSRLTQAMSRALGRRDFTGVLILGALNGLLPCGLVYSALLVSASLGGPVHSALGMLAFGVGTVPALLLVGMGAPALSARVRVALSRAAGIVILLVGLQLSMRGLAVLGVVPSLHLGGLVIW